MQEKLIRIGVFYDGNYFLHVSNYYNFEHPRKRRLSISGLHEFIKHQVGQEEATDVRLCQIVDAHYFRGRLNAQEAIYKTVEFQEDFSFLKVEIVARYNTTQIKSFVERNINTRDSEPSLKKESDIENLFSENPEKPSPDTVKKVVNALLDGQLKIKVEASDVGNVISQLLKNRFEIDYLNSVKTKNGQTCFKDMTGGQKAIALLELIFRFDDEKYPILIDQPEDDLDVGGVATDLVNFIKTEKDDRQLIVVTHNASLVVCSDTEEVIVSEIALIDSGGYDFKYATGSIENQDRRGDIIRVLEGGEESLQKRMRKLNIK